MVEQPAEHRVVVEEFGKGYRPTATGRIGERPFAFRVTDGAWTLVVGKPLVGEVWWHSGPQELDFKSHGTCEAGLWHTDSLPVFAEALRRYLVDAGLDEKARASLLDAALAEAAAAFADT